MWKATFLNPMGLETLGDHRSTDVQDWKVKQLWYNGKFYSSPEELSQKYTDGEVDMVALRDLLPKNTMGPILLHGLRGFPSHYCLWIPCGPGLLSPCSLEGNTMP